MRRNELSNVSNSHNSKKVTPKPRTFRFDLVLGESTSESCSEYSFTDLVKNKTKDSGDRFDDHDDQSEVVAIVQRFEAKYGPRGNQSGKKRRTQEMDDYYDPGTGYDEADPFIDNTEAYDEVIPASMTTEHGGFYISHGKLEFKFLNDDCYDSTKPVSKKKKVRVLGSESDGDEGGDVAKKVKSIKRKRRKETKEEKVDIKKESTEKEEKATQKTTVDVKKPVTATLLETNIVSPPHPNSLSVPPVATNTSVSAAFIVDRVAMDMATNGTAEVKSDGHLKDETNAFEETFNAVLRVSVNDDSSSKSGEDGKGDNVTVERNTPLPSQLPPDLLEAIEMMKQVAKKTKEKKFFSANINKLLLEIELGSHKLPWGSKTAVYNHLSEHLPYGKYTLQRRAKKLRESQEESQLKSPILKLREAISKVMPAQEKQHDLDIQRAKIEYEVKNDPVDRVKEELSTESEGEEKIENKKKPRGPRRKFQWNSEIRDLLVGIVSTKMQHYGPCKTHSQTTEEYLKAYLDSDIKSLWPPGWMQARTLFKESRKAHEDFPRGTTQSNKQKKFIPSSDPASIPGISHVSKMDNLIEVSKVIDSVDGNKKTVVINLPNSVVSMPQMYSSSILSSSTFSGRDVKEQFKINTHAGHVTQITLPVIPAVQQTPFVSSTFPENDVFAVSLPDSPRMPTNQESDEINTFIPAPSQRKNGGHREQNLVPSSSTPFIGSSQVILDVLDKLNNNRSPKFNTFLSSSNQIPQFRTNNQHRDSSEQQISVLPQPKTALSQQQAVYTKQENITLQDNTVQGNMLMNSFKTENTITQEINLVNSQQSGRDTNASSLDVARKDVPNTSWSKVRSVMSPSKLDHPDVTANRVQKTADNKNGNRALEQNKTLKQNQQQIQTLKTFAKSSQNIVDSNSKKISLETLKNRTGITQVNTVLSSKEDSRKQASELYEDVLKISGQSNTKFKSITPAGNLVQKLESEHLQKLKTALIIGSNTVVKMSPSKASDFSGWVSKNEKNLSSLLSSKPVLPASVLARSSSSLSQSISSKQPEELLNNTKIQTSQNNSLVSQTTNVSAESTSELATLSLFEQIKAHLHQEAIEGQALKNLAMAFKHGESTDL